MALDVVFVKRQRLVDRGEGLLLGLREICTESELDRLAEGAGLPRISLGEAWIELDRRFQQAQRLGVVLAGDAMVVDATGENIDD